MRSRVLSVRRAAATAVLLVVGASALVATPASTVARPDREVGHTKVLALVEAPGYPANVFRHPNGRVYAGTFSNPRGDAVPSVVREWTRGGTLLRSWTVPGQDLTQPHGVQVATADARGRLMVLDKGSGRILMLDIRTGRWWTYAQVRDVPGGAGPIPNYAAWGRDGSLYVTDYGQPVIWRIPRGGDRAWVFHRDQKLDGGTFGTTGIVYRPQQQALYVMQQSSLGLGEPTVAQGKLYRLFIGEDPNGDVAPPSLDRLWTSGLLDLPDGFSFGESGNVYVALAGTNQIAVLDKHYRPVRKIGALVSGDNGSPVPFDTPSNVTFAGESVLVANQSYLTGTEAHHAILDVHVGESGVPVYIPESAGRPRR
ncbi:sugar lactone lactonase YvrE [Nocardioides thalensis]|uniref:Sugar lactone lactonase YvrE n=1 Tax=Nocardioides thalensis TaxID=1914755 RepID=A0A853C1Y0_9ACTN|nr:hypothetical protein [Nocardioides thalensis]NYJ01625.1 sugar lactone lactonase YvrE [Nocardioides thalensis]